MTHDADECGIFFFFLFIYLKGKEKNTENLCAGSLPQMAVTAGAAVSQSQEPGASSGPAWVQQPKNLVHPLLLSQQH